MNFPKFYNPWLHLIFPSLFALLIGYGLISTMSSVYWTEFLTIPIALIILSSWEWIIHRYWMHRLFKPFKFLHTKHLEHHKLYTDQHMEIKSWKEFYYVLTPFYAIILVFVTLLPIFAIVNIWSWNVACLFLITTLIYFVLYELSHVSYHLPKNHWLKSNKIIYFLSQHHRTHHNPLNMTKYNFNVTAPLFDWICQTWRNY